MDLFAAASTITSAPSAACAAAKFPADLFEACQVQELRPSVLAVPMVEVPPPSAYNDNDGDAQALAAIVDLLTGLWREATGDDLRRSLKTS